MNGIHDLGGMDGFGPVEVEADEPVFHADWERRVFGLVSVASAQVVRNVDAFRHAIERMDPAHYLGSSYYEHWLTGLATLLVERGLLTRTELAAALPGGVPLGRPERPGTLPAATGDPAAPRFTVGSAVVVRTLHPSGHTRCPRYVRGKRGVVIRVDGAFGLPDVHAHSERPCTERTYGVRFGARELWGPDAGAAESVAVDLWESYLDAAPAGTPPP